MKGYRITLEGQTFEVELLSDPAKESVQVRVNGQAMTVNVAPLNRAQPLGPAPPPDPRPAVPTPLPASGSSLLSPLPGTIIKIEVQPGQVVAAGQPLLEIEAMKMNNPIRSPRQGTIKEMLVRTGQQVAHGEPLLTWEG